jgi:uncharacterized membrane protein YphA (DoxX/SURF4 family)
MTPEQKTTKTTNIILWIAQGLLAMTFVWSGFMKLLKPEDLPFLWIQDNTRLVLLTGVIDLLAGFGIVLPALLRIKPNLTVFAACGIAILMVAASIFHISRGEANDIGFNVTVFFIALFIAWGRRK